MALPPTVKTPELRRVRELLHEEGFSASRIQEALGTEGGPLLEHAHAPVHRRRLQAIEGAFPALVSLFLLGDPVEPDALGDAATDLVELGLAEATGGSLTGTVRLVPHEEFLIVSDPPGAAAEEHVAGIHVPSALLANLTVRLPVARGLDIGTGNGIQAILLAAHCERVVATDLNERALAFAEFNFALNDATGIELRHGSFLEPVAGERFDVVVSNPPYVISPETEFLFRDGGLAGDAVSESLVRALPDVLEDDAYATVTVSWVHEGGELDDRPRSWLEGSGCDAWILHTATEDPLTTAGVWNRDRAKDPDDYAASIDRWTAYFAREGIAEIAYGALVLRKRAGGGVVRSTHLPRARVGPASRQLLRLFAAQDALAADADVLDRRLVPAPEVRLAQTLRPHEGGWARCARTLALDGGLAFVADLDEPSARLVSALGDGHTVREAAELAAAALGIDATNALEAGGDLARRLLELGFLVPPAP
ncbi:MAG: methyltransferase [Actinomycetota bacterium]|nr:methyltransferase [Actinomycetota bacterium]